jgi:hypothetical protein
MPSTTNDTEVPDQPEVESTLQKFLSLLPYVLFAAGLISVGVAVWIKHTNWNNREIIAEVVKEVGIAAAVVGIVTISIEKWKVKSFTAELEKVVDRKLDEIKSITKDAVFQGPLPREYYEQISKTMVNDHRWFAQLDWEVSLDLRWKATDSEYIDVFIEQGYKIQNISSFDKTFTIRHFESKDFDDKFPGATSFRFVRAWLKETPMSPLLDVQLAAANPTAPYIKEDLEEVQFKADLDIPKARCLCVRVGSRKVLRDRHYESRFIFRPTLGASFKITAPDDVDAKLDVPTLLKGKPEDQLKVGEEKNSDGRTTTHWLVGTPLPPATCVFVIWRRKDMTPANLPPAPAPQPQKAGLGDGSKTVV